MVTVEHAIVARLEQDGLKFEILVDPDLALELKKGKPVSIANLVAMEDVYKDAKKGETQSDANVLKVFKTNDFESVVRHIILHGQVQLTTDQRRKLLEEKKTELVQFIVRNAINPQTKAPHPPQRIQNALEEAKFSVDAFKSVEEQVPLAVKAIKHLIPISLEQLKIAVKIPASVAGRANSILHKYGVQKEEWQRDGSLIAIMELPSGLKQDLFNELNKLAHGQIESKLLN